MQTGRQSLFFLFLFIDASDDEAKSDIDFDEEKDSEFESDDDLCLPPFVDDTSGPLMKIDIRKITISSTVYSNEYGVVKVFDIKRNGTTNAKRLICLTPVPESMVVHFKVEDVQFAPAI